jgi:hypothetical protein
MRLHLENIEGGMKRLSSVIVAEAVHQNATWPFVTVPAFEAVGASVRAQTGFELILFCPMVREAQVEEWEEYSVESASRWLAESQAICLSESAATGKHSSLEATDYLDGAVTPTILDLVSGVKEMSAGSSLELKPAVESGGPYFPIWMQTPAPFSPRLININFLSTGPTIKPLLSAILTTGRPLLSYVLDITSLSKLNIKFEDHERYHSSLVKYQSNSTTSTFQHPHSPYLYPVYAGREDGTTSLVAILAAILPFDRYLINLLPEGVYGIDAVLRNGDQDFTYRLEGNSVRSCFNHASRF